MSTAIEARDLFRIYDGPDGAAALQGLSLAVGEREVVVVLGPSGSGKTTLLRILAGLDHPSAGTLRVLGDDLGRLSRRALADYRARETGYAEQHYAAALAPELTARELVGLRLGLQGAFRRERLRRADELLERVGLAGRRDARPAELSGGEQQRVALCAAIAHRPRIFLGDEPTGELDHANAQLLYALIGELVRQERCTAVVVSHDPESASIADRIIHVRDGRLSGEEVREQGGEEAIVVGRGGWLRLPEEFLLRAGITSRATATVAGGAIVVSSPEGAPAPLHVSPQPTVAASAQGDAVAVVRGLAKRYGSGTVFEKFDGAFAAGALTALTGPSGSGKTTLLRLLAGLELPDAGEVELLSRRLDGLTRAERAELRRRHIAVVGQEASLVPFLSASENVGLGLQIRGHGEGEQRALEALDAVGLGELADRRVASLSAGELERVAIARALASRPALLLADEPTSRLDQANAITVGSLLARFAHESGAAVVCATHDRVLIEQADAELSLARLTHITAAA